MVSRPNKKNAAGPILMDSRKFLGAINASYQARVALMERHVREAGASVNRTWKLAGLNQNTLFVEDVDEGAYYQAAYAKNGGEVTISDWRRIKLVESQRQNSFETCCKAFVEGIAEGDKKSTQAAWGKMAAHKFSGRLVPTSGLVKTHDGVTRRLNVASESTLDASSRPRLVAAIVEGIRNKVVIKEGKPVGVFRDKPFRLPISDWTCHKVVARAMRKVASDAYMAEGFQNRIVELASLVNEGKIQDAVRSVSGFLVEQQEFTLLTKNEIEQLIGDALASKGVFNHRLAEDVATLVRRTNLRVNKKDVVSEWREVARKAGHPTLMDNVSLLEAAENFESAHDQFVRSIFHEAIGPKDVQVDAYKTALGALKDTPRIKESEDLSGKIDELIERLQQPDHAVIAEVEDLLAEVKNELGQLENLDNFDEMPGGEGDEDVGLDDVGSEGGTGTTVNFNITIGKDGSVSGLDGAGEEAEEGDDDADLAELLQGDDDEGLGDEDEGLGDEESDDEGLGDDEGEGDEGDDELAKLLKGESVEPKTAMSEDSYAYAAQKNVKINSLGADYGVKPIEIASDCMKAVDAALQLAEERGLDGHDLLEAVRSLAVEGMQTVGLIVPDRRRDEAVEQVCDAFFDELDRRGIPFSEDQYKWPWRHVWGRKKSAIGKRERKRMSESRIPAAVARKGVRWLQESEMCKLGEFASVKFLYDWAPVGGGPVIMSEDGQIEVPIPRELHESASAAAKIGNGDSAPFINWLGHNVSQLLQAGSAEEAAFERSLQEASIHITAGPDGTIDLTVDGEEMMSTGIEDPMGEPGLDVEPGMDLEPGAGAGVTDLDAEPGIEGPPVGMKPVEMMPPSEDEGGGLDDLEGAEEEAEEAEGEAGEAEEEAGEAEEDAEEAEEDVEDAEEEEESDGPPEGVVEDNDLTTPKNKKYNTAKDDHRKPPKAKKIGNAGTSLDGISNGEAPKTPGVDMKKITKK